MTKTTFNGQRWAAAVQAVLDEHKLTIRGQRLRTGIAHSSVVTWLQGVQPRMEAVIRWANGFGLNVNEWLALAGYEPLETPGSEPRALFWAGFERLVTISRDCQAPDPQVPSFRGGLDSMTRETVEVVLRDLIAVQLERNPIRASKMRAALERDPVLGPLVTGPRGAAGQAHALAASTR